MTRIDKHCMKRAWQEQWREVRPAVFLILVCVALLLVIYV